jgi:predicted DNA-binding transcriptional regulator YafY
MSLRADRLLSLMLYLQAKKSMTAGELAERLEVSERTVYRDVEALSMAGVPVYTQSGPGGGIFLDEGYRTSLSGLTAQEIQSLFVASAPGPLEDLGLARVVEQSLLKLLASLPYFQRNEAERMRQRIYIDPTGWFEAEEHVPLLPLLQEAVWDDHLIEMTYQRRDGSLSKRIIEAYGLVAKSNTWYLVGRSADGEMRMFRVSRIQDATLSERRFKRDPAFDLANYWQEAAQAFEKQVTVISNPEPCLVTMKVHPDIAYYFASDLSGHYRRLGEPDSQGWLTFEVTFPAFHGAVARVLSFADRVIVLTPTRLRDEVLEAARRLTALYGSDNA